MHDGDDRLQRIGRLAAAGDARAAWQAGMDWRLQGGAPAALDLLLGQIALAQGRAGEAAVLFQACAEADPACAAQAGLGLAGAYAAQGDAARARQVLEALLAAEPTRFLARLQLAELLESEGQPDAALHAYHAAVVHAQQQGRWLDDATTAPAMRPRVGHAMARIEAGRQDLLLGLLEPLRVRHGRQALDRVERGLRMYLGLLPTQYADPRQRPTFLYVPGLPAEPYPDRALFPWLEALEQQAAAIGEEMLATRTQAGDYAPFLGAPAQALPAGLLDGTRGVPAWDAYFLYRHGRQDPAHAAQCPRTIAALERTPLVRIRDHAPEICFSVLAPGSHILPHRGITNTRLTVHLPLVVPEGCALKAGGIEHAWQAGQAMVFDDTFEHEAWNRGEGTRIILLMDTWNPHLQPVEREAVTALVEAIGDFNAGARQAAGTGAPPWA